MRCDGCEGKFGANGDPEVEAESYDVSNTTLTAEIRVSVSCANCSSEWKEGYLSLEQEIDTDAHDADCEIIDPETGVAVKLEDDEERFQALVGAGERTFTITEVDVVVDEDYRPKERTRTLKDGTVKTTRVPMRAQRHYYDVTATFSVRCEACSGDFEAVVNDSLGAGELEAA